MGKRSERTSVSTVNFPQDTKAGFYFRPFFRNLQSESDIQQIGDGCECGKGNNAKKITRQQRPIELLLEGEI